jgi:acetyl-CoA carboxylase beta subunit
MHITLPEGAIRAETAIQHGQIDAIVQRRDLRKVLARLLRFFSVSKISSQSGNSLALLSKLLSG